MTVPLIQDLIKNAWRMDPAGGNNCAADAGKNALTASDECVKNWAEAWAFAAAVLPQVHQCNAAAATTIRDNVDITAVEPMKDGFAAVKAALESTYPCLGITCADVGAYQSSGVVYTGADACTTPAPTPRPIAAGSPTPRPAATIVYDDDDDDYTPTYSYEYEENLGLAVLTSCGDPLDDYIACMGDCLLYTSPSPRDRG